MNDETDGWNSIGSHPDGGVIATVFYERWKASLALLICVSGRKWLCVHVSDEKVWNDNFLWNRATCAWLAHSRWCRGEPRDAAENIMTVMTFYFPMSVDRRVKRRTDVKCFAEASRQNSFSVWRLWTPFAHHFVPEISPLFCVFDSRSGDCERPQRLIPIFLLVKPFGGDLCVGFSCFSFIWRLFWIKQIACVHLMVGWLVCQQEYTKSTKHFSTKLGWTMLRAYLRWRKTSSPCLLSDFKDGNSVLY